jgi:hypothetical protein
MVLKFFASDLNLFGYCLVHSRSFDSSCLVPSCTRVFPFYFNKISLAVAKDYTFTISR